MDRNELTLAVAGALTAAVLLGWLIGAIAARLAGRGPHALAEARTAVAQAEARAAKAEAECARRVAAAEEAAAQARAEADRLRAAPESDGTDVGRR